MRSSGSLCISSGLLANSFLTSKSISGSVGPMKNVGKDFCIDSKNMRSCSLYPSQELSCFVLRGKLSLKNLGFLLRIFLIIAPLDDVWFTMMSASSSP